MNTASLELCKKLHELSGWGDSKDNANEYDTLLTWYCDEERDDTPVRNFSNQFALRAIGGPGYYTNTYPAYDCGYLLRKLPVRMAEKRLQLEPYDETIEGGGWNCGYFNDYEEDSVGVNVDADTPENALASLAIELFNMGILEKRLR